MGSNLRNTNGTPKPMDVYTKQIRIAELAKEDSKRSFISLNHYLDEDWLREAFNRTRKTGAVGVDKVNASTYAENLEANLSDLLNRVKSGKYVSPPVKRGWLPKPGTTEKRPIGIPTFERKVLERAILMLLEPIYEQDFMDCSFGFRSGRSAHDALESIWRAVNRNGCYWVLDVDIRKYFDTLNFQHLRAFLGQRVRDGMVCRLINKWLKAGVWERGVTHYPEVGAPQGSVISPVLSNIYLHEVLDVWFHEVARPRLKGQAYLIRFADDFVMCCQYREDAERLIEVLPKRFGKYGLELHPEKTRVVDFRPPCPANDGSTQTFDFLGFTHYWGKTRHGKAMVKRQTAKSRQMRAVQKITKLCRQQRHDSLQTQQIRLSRSLQGHFGYFGLTGNTRQPNRLLAQTQRIWHKWLKRRDRGKSLTWERFRATVLKQYPLPTVRTVAGIEWLQRRKYAGILC